MSSDRIGQITKTRQAGGTGLGQDNVCPSAPHLLLAGGQVAEGGVPKEGQRVLLEEGRACVQVWGGSCETEEKQVREGLLRGCGRSFVGKQSNVCHEAQAAIYGCAAPLSGTLLCAVP
eukprot:1156363-Pelagomonas_calceolata.AAC.1